MNRTYCTHIPKWFHPNHHGQLQKPTGGWWNANQSPFPWGRDGMDPQETWQGQRWKRKTWKVEEEGAGAQDYQPEAASYQPEAASNRSFGGGEEMVNFGPWFGISRLGNAKRNSPSRSHQIILRISGIWIIFSVAYWVGIESSNWNYHFDSKSYV